MVRESDFQASLIKEIKKRLPGAYVFKMDSSQLQGCPDLIILYKDKWAMLEVKASRKSTKRPNQRIRVSAFNEMSFAAFIFPENKEEVLHEMELALGA